MKQVIDAVLGTSTKDGLDIPAADQGGRQLNQLLGANTVAFHQQFPIPRRGTIELPNPGVINGSGGTPNQKAERLANRIAATRSGRSRFLRRGDPEGAEPRPGAGAPG